MYASGRRPGIAGRGKPEAATRTAFAALLALAACASRAPAQGHDEIRFSHHAHAEAQVGCGMCHQSSYDAKSPARDFRPSMARCLECHEQWKAKNRCEMCHTDVRFARHWQTAF